MQEKKCITDDFMLAIKHQSVIIIYMKINDEHSLNNPNAEDAMEAILSVLNEMFIQPAYKSGELEVEDEYILAEILGALKIIGQKAKNYELLENQDSFIFRN